MDEPRIAPDGAIWVCRACGKTGRDLYGDPGTSWDESCAMNAILCDAASLRRGPFGVISAEPFKPARDGGNGNG